MKLTKLLLNEEPLVVLPSLAVAIGLNESMFLQQIHYWCNRSKHIKNGSRWIYNTIQEWNQQFPFWSESTIKRIIKDLRERNLIIVKNFNKVGYDRTNWYTVNYLVLDELSKEIFQESENLDGIDTIEGEEVPQVDKPKQPEVKAVKLDHNNDPEFNEFWEVYPKKVSKKQAYTPFKRALKEHGMSKVLVGAKYYAVDMAKKQTDIQFILNPATFLNNERFLDYYNHYKPTQQSQEKPKQMMGIGEM
jgi:hypothetical protein